MANHIAEVARMLGVEIGEIFKIADDTHDDCQRYHRFTKNAVLKYQMMALNGKRPVQ